MHQLQGALCSIANDAAVPNAYSRTFPFRMAFQQQDADPPARFPTQSDAELQWGMIQMGEPGAPWKSAKVRDLWAHEDLGTFAGSFVFKGLEPHAAAFLVVTEA